VHKKDIGLNGIDERIVELKKEMMAFVEENAKRGADNVDFDEHYAEISVD